MTATHPLAHIPVEPWMYRRAKEQAELLMQIALNTPASKPAPQPVNTQRKVA